MSDYLGRLAARVAAPARLIRPRTLSVFESTTEPEAPAVPVRSSTRATQVVEKIVERERIVPVAVHEERAAPSGAPHPAPAAPPSPRERSEGPPPPQAPLPARGESLAEGPVRGAARPIVTPAPASSDIVIERREPPQRIVRERRVAERIDRLRVRRERTLIEQTNILTEAPIEVTIGRIDVRAVVAPPRPAAPRATAAAPAMSLKDYLSERDARRR